MFSGASEALKGISMILTGFHLSSPTGEDYRMPGQEQGEWAGKRWWWPSLCGSGAVAADGADQIVRTDGLMDGVELRGDTGTVQEKDRHQCFSWIPGLRVGPFPNIKITPNRLRL